MIKYVAAAMTLKAFSANPVTRRIYRKLGNRFGATKRATGVMPSYYFERVSRMLRLHQRYGTVKNGDRLLEVGTGWLHWEAMTCSLFFDIQGVLFDVWDNRQLGGLKNYVGQLDAMLDKLDLQGLDLDRVRRLIREIGRMQNFEDIYRLLGFQYCVDESGRLRQLEPASFDVVVSGGVLEHVERDSAAALVNDFATVLKPGGYSCHSIHIGDHLSRYDRSVGPKQYLRYSDRSWRRWFENRVQYINRLQRSDWLELFRKTDLVLVEEEIDAKDLADIAICDEYRRYDEVDLRCVNLKLLHRKSS
jgi:SAM-dependent methyltransferase